MANDPESPAQDAPVAKDAEPSAVVTISKNMKYTGSVNVPFRLVPGEGLTAESYATSSAAVATVDGATGIVEPQKTGSCKITVNLSNGKKLSLSLKVIDPTIPTGIVLSRHGSSMMTANSMGGGPEIRIRRSARPSCTRISPAAPTSELRQA